MGNKDLILGIDIGTTGTKCSVYDFQEIKQLLHIRISFLIYQYDCIRTADSDNSNPATVNILIAKDSLQVTLHSRPPLPWLLLRPEKRRSGKMAEGKYW